MIALLKNNILLIFCSYKLVVNYKNRIDITQEICINGKIKLPVCEK